MVFLCRLKDDLVHFVMGTPPPKDKSQYFSPNNDRTKLQNIQTRKLNVKKPKISRVVSCTMKKHKKTFATWCDSRSRTMEQNYSATFQSNKRKLQNNLPKWHGTPIMMLMLQIIPNSSKIGYKDKSANFFVLHSHHTNCLRKRNFSFIGTLSLLSCSSTNGFW